MMHSSQKVDVVVEQEVVVADYLKPTNNKSDRKWIKNGIIVLILVVIAGIFIVKSIQNEKEIANEQQIEKQNTEDTTGSETASSFPLKITKTDIEEIKAYGVPTVIDFGSDSCIPCKEMAPVLETLNAEWQDKAAVQFMDVWKYTDGVEDFPVSVIPTQVFFNADGTPFVPSDELARQIEFTMYSDKSTEEHVFTVHQGGITEEQMRMIFAEMGVV